MVFKVIYQESLLEAPIRERTKSLYVEAESIREVRLKLADRNLNIELVQPLDPEHLAYEQASEFFELEQI